MEVEIVKDVVRDIREWILAAAIEGYRQGYKLGHSLGPDEGVDASFQQLAVKEVSALMTDEQAEALHLRVMHAHWRELKLIETQILPPFTDDQMPYEVQEVVRVIKAAHAKAIAEYEDYN